MSVTRQERLLRQTDAVEELFNRHPGGVTKKHLAEALDIPDTSVSGLFARLRANATEVGHTPKTLKIGGVWIYGWAETMGEHHEEHRKRRINERKSLRLTIATLEQSITERPDAEELKDQLRAARHRFEDVDAQIERLSGVLSLLRTEDVPA